VQAGFGALFAVPGLTFVIGLLSRQALPGATPHIGNIVIGIIFLQCFTIFILYWFIPTFPSLVRPEAPRFERLDLARVTESAEAFSGLWRYAWLCWALLYFVIGLSLIYKAWYPQENLWFIEPITNAFNNIQTVFFVMCFRELRYPTHQKQSPLFASIVAVLAISTLEALFLIPDNPMRSSFGQPFSHVAGWASGFAAGAAIALLVGRLESKLIDVSAKIIAVFYLYASIQGAYPFLTLDPAMTLTLTSLAFIFKIILYMFMYWIFQSGILQFYLWQSVDLDSTVPKAREEFLKSAITVP